jgi:hypothetical protein
VTTSTDKTIEWLLDGDPAIRWQTLRDLVGASARTVAAERKRVAQSGWGARLLAEQSTDGRWGGGSTRDAGLYTPKWTSTTYTMLLLRDFGLEAENENARKACALLLDSGLKPDGGIDYGKQRDQLRAGCDLLIGTPGRLLDHASRHLHRIRTTQLDELYRTAIPANPHRNQRLVIAKSRPRPHPMTPDHQSAQAACLGMCW